MSRTTDSIRNLAIIAHVDHGKTTLIDSMFRQSGIFRENQSFAERVMDSNDLEKERGITILAKCTALEWEGTTFNIIDTPGHADFGGEVERVLSMVDGALLLVDSAEGPLPQTKFVLNKALQLGFIPIVVINKVDRSDAQIDVVHEAILELFMTLDASEEQFNFPIFYASGRDGWSNTSLDGSRESLVPLFKGMKEHIPAPKVDSSSPFAMRATMLDLDPYLGRVLTGRVDSGIAEINMPVRALNLDGSVVEQARVTKLLSFRGIERIPVESAQAGDIIAIAGLQTASVADTIAAPCVTTPLPATPIDPPTMAITIAVNDSPLAGTEGTKLTSRLIRDRLATEAQSNITITVEETQDRDAFSVGGRGELQLGVLIETLRREGFELSVSRPRVLTRQDPDTGATLEPIEMLYIDVDEEHNGVVMKKLSLRKGELQEMAPSGGGKVRMVFHIPSRGLIGYQSDFLTDTRGTGIMCRLFHGYAPHCGVIDARRNGSLISMADGVMTDYALWNLEERGVLFVSPQQKTYEGMIIGQHSRESDLEVNPVKTKQLTNVRAASKDESMRLTPPKKMTLEEAIAYIASDELVEVTPKNVRLRKQFLKAHERKRQKNS